MPEQRMVPVEFKPCPFCGKPPRYLEHKAGFWSERVICDDCNFHLPPEGWEKRALIDGPGVEPFAYYVYFPDAQDGEFCDDLDDLIDRMTNERHEVTPLFSASPSAPVARCHECGACPTDKEK